MGQIHSEADRKGNSFGSWLFVLFASPALLLFAGRAEPPGAALPAPVEARASPGSTPARPSEACVRRFLGPLEALAHDAPRDTAVAAPSQSSLPSRLSESLASVRAALGPTTELEAFIATVADPIDSGLGYQFDTSLKALRSGFEKAVTGERAECSEEATANDGERFNRDRAWLPWDDRELEGDPRRASEECRRTLPGLVLFRGGTHLRPRLRALLLVGETPTAGVHRSAFMSALEIARLFGGSGKSPGDQIGILGPTFSGSAHSMRLVLDQWASRETSRSISGVRIVTGTATGNGLRAQLATAPSTGPTSLEFHSTTPTEADLQCRYLKFVNRRRLASAPHAAAKEHVLHEVALLHEGGTEFGASLQRDRASALGGPADGDNPLRCTTESGAELRAGIELSFPMQIGRLRDAYEDMDRKGLVSTGSEPVGRRTSLPISLREKRPLREAEAEPSPKTTYAEDIAVAQLLGVVSRSSVEHVAIHSTDVGDAIFLARKIRDVAPDVRIAFFSADVLLLHPSFKRDLEGSLVVGAYPFFGANDFYDASPPRNERRHFIGFESSASEGTYNAVLALRGAFAPELSGYEYTDRNVVLPIWISAIGSGQLVPIIARPNQSQVYAGSQPRSGASRGLGTAKLTLAGDVRFPRLWHFLFACLTLGFCVDQVHQRRAARSLSAVSVVEDRHDGHVVPDANVIKTKWELYAAVRSFVFAMSLAYMAHVYLFTFDLYERTSWFSTVVICCASATAVIGIGFAAAKTAVFAADYMALGRSVGRSSILIALSAQVRKLRRGEPAERATPDRVPHTVGTETKALGFWDRNMLPLGLARAENVSASELSFCQLRALANVVLFVSLLFVVVEGYLIMKGAEQAEAARTLMVLRSVTLVGGVSPAAPTLLCLALAYVWAFGRMARLQLAFGLALITPALSTGRAVATPIRFILYPNHRTGAAADESFGHIERYAMNSIVRPITGPDYCTAVAILALLPVVLFRLKPVATLEREVLTALLMAALGLSAFLIVNTLVQLVQYWLALKQLLKRVLQHRLGRSFERVARFVRDSLEDQISRTPQDVLRLGACAARFDELVRWSKHLTTEGSGAFASLELATLETRRREIEKRRVSAMAADATARADASGAEAALGCAVITGAHDLMKLLIGAWDGQLASKISAALGPPSSIAPRPHLSIDSRHAPVGSSRQRAAELPKLPAPPERGFPRRTERRVTMRPSPPLAGVTTSVHLDTLRPAVHQSTSAPPRHDGTFTPTQPLGTALPAYHPSSETLEPESGPRRVVPAAAAEDETQDLLDDALRGEGWRYSPNQRIWLREAGGFVATVVALLLSRHVRQFHNFVQTLTLCSLALLLVVLSYPFEPHRLLRTFVMIAVLGVVTVGFWIYIELDRSTLLSHIAGSVPGKLTLDAALIRRVFAWGVVPLLVIAAAQYPDFANALLRVADPVARALK